MLIVLDEESLTEKLVGILAGDKTATVEQTKFLKERVVVPLLKQLAPSEKILWYFLDKQVLLPGRYSMIGNAVTKDETKEFMNLFSRAIYRIYFITTERLLTLSVIDWLEQQEIKAYNLTDMAYIVVGQIYDPAVMLGNYKGFAYRTKENQYDVIKCDEQTFAELFQVLDSLDPEDSYHKRIKDVSLLDFARKNHYTSY